MVSTRLLLALVLIAAPPLLVASGNDTYEVWAIDQSNSPGTTYGGTLYIWDALVSFVASGHVLVIDAATRTPVDCLWTSVGAGGARQVHFAIPSPDQRALRLGRQPERQALRAHQHELPHQQLSCSTRPPTIRRR